jgi:hypothetical protein
MLGGIGIGLLSSAKNKKLIAIAGAILIAIGISGMITVGSQALSLLTSNGGFGSQELAKSFFYGEYIFLFMIVTGLVLLIFGLVTVQSDRNKISN